MASSPNLLDATDGFNACIAGGIATEFNANSGDEGGRDRGRASEALAQEIQKKAKAECCTGDSEKGGSSALHN